MRRPLDALSFFLADVRDGLGPYLAIYLLLVQDWNPASIGLVMSVAGAAGILAQTPAGALVDRTRAKRAVLVAAAVAVTACSLALPLLPQLWFVLPTQAAAGVAAAVFPPVVAAITLGAVGPKAFARRSGRNEAFNHAGNAAAALIAGAAAYFFGPVAVFWLMAAMAAASIAAALSVPADAIDHDTARGLPEHGEGSADAAAPSGWRAVLGCRPLLLFAACTTLFHFANAAMLPLVGQKLALLNPELGTTLMSACIVAAQAVMVPVAAITGAKADRWGRKPFFLVALAVLAARGALYPVADDPYWLLSVQLLDGIGAGVFGVLFPLIVADLTRGTGRFNVSLGAIVTAQGIGAALSNGIAGLVVVRAGYDAAFLFLAAVACAGLALFWLAMPETSEERAAGETRPTLAGTPAG